MRLPRLLLSRQLATLLDVGPFVTVYVGSEARMARIIRRSDQFQQIGIPCWRSFAGPLDSLDRESNAESE